MKQIKLVLVASGGGTDAQAIIEAHQAGCIPEVSEIAAVISTKEAKGNISMAEEHGVRSIVVDQTKKGFKEKMVETLKQLDVQLVFLVGCITLIPEISGIKMYNIHPQHKVEFGGKTMHGLKPHLYFLKRVLDLIERGRASANDTFFVNPTVHDAHGKSDVNTGYDCGNDLLVGGIPVPQQLIWACLSDPTHLEAQAKKLQDHVLPYEWIILPCAVRIAAKLIIDEINVVK